MASKRDRSQYKKRTPSAGPVPPLAIATAVGSGVGPSGPPLIREDLMSSNAPQFDHPSIDVREILVPGTGDILNLYRMPRNKKEIEALVADSVKFGIKRAARIHSVTEDAVRACVAMSKSVDLVTAGIKRIGTRPHNPLPYAHRVLRQLAAWESGATYDQLHRIAPLKSWQHLLTRLEEGRLLRARSYALIAIRLPTDRKPFGVSGPGPSCSGCVHFHRLGQSIEWGICANADSPRVGMLTHQLQGGYACGRLENLPPSASLATKEIASIKASDL